MIMEDVSQALVYERKIILALLDPNLRVQDLYAFVIVTYLNVSFAYTALVMETDKHRLRLGR